MKVFITGATGLVGSYLSRLLLLKGYHVMACKRPHSSMRLLDGAEHDIEWSVGDIMDPSYLQEILKDADAVIHCAAVVSFSKDDKEKMYNVNVQGTSNVVSAAQSSGIKKLLFVSSIAAIGRTMENKIVTEDNTWIDSPYNTDYAKSKYLAEQEVWKGYESGLNVSIINPSVILGAGDWDSGSVKLFKTIRKGLKFYPIGATGVVDVRDVAKSLVILLESDKHNGHRFIINGHNMSYYALFKTMASHLDTEAPSIRVGKLFIPLTWRIAKLVAMIKGVHPTITKDTAMTSSLTFIYENRKSVQEMGMEYIMFENTIKAAAKALIHFEKTGENKVLPF